MPFLSCCLNWKKKNAQLIDQVSHTEIGIKNQNLPPQNFQNPVAAFAKPPTDNP